MSWLIVAAVLLLLYFLPLGADVRYDSAGFRLMAIFGPIRIRLLPASKKKPKEQKKKKSETPKKPPQAATKKAEEDPAGGSWTDFLPIARTALSLLNGLRRKIRVNRLQMQLIMAGDDPCDLAVNYGRAWAALGNLQPALERCFVIRKRDLSVTCDFEGTQTLVLLRMKLTITLGRLLWLLLRYGVQAIYQYFTIQKHRKGGIEHEQNTSQHAREHHFQNP